MVFFLLLLLLLLLLVAMLMLPIFQLTKTLNVNICDRNLKQETQRFTEYFSLFVMVFEILSLLEVVVVVWGVLLFVVVLMLVAVVLMMLLLFIVIVAFHIRFLSLALILNISRKHRKITAKTEVKFHLSLSKANFKQAS